MKSTLTSSTRFLMVMIESSVASLLSESVKLPAFESDSRKCDDVGPYRSCSRGIAATGRTRNGRDDEGQAANRPGQTARSVHCPHSGFLSSHSFVLLAPTLRILCALGGLSELSTVIRCTPGSEEPRWPRFRLTVGRFRRATPSYKRSTRAIRPINHILVNRLRTAGLYLRKERPQVLSGYAPMQGRAGFSGDFFRIFFS